MIIYGSRSMFNLVLMLSMNGYTGDFLYHGEGIYSLEIPTMNEASYTNRTTGYRRVEFTVKNFQKLIAALMQTTRHVVNVYIADRETIVYTQDVQFYTVWPNDTGKRALVERVGTRVMNKWRAPMSQESIAYLRAWEGIYQVEQFLRECEKEGVLEKAVDDRVLRGTELVPQQHASV